MLPSPELVMLSRWQFGVSAMYHFLFVPLTLGLAWILLIMESVYVMTGKPIYKDMTQFWGKLFAINFVMGIITGLTLELQFGQNWAYFSQYIGNVFGTPLAIEGIVAFMLESTLFGIFFFGWDRVSKVQHLMATFALAVGSSLSALVIMVANGWMQHPVGAHFNFETMRFDLISFPQLFLNVAAQVNFIHVLSSGYVAGSVFVLGISAYYILKNRDLPFAKRSFVIAAGFGLASVLSVIYLGDANGQLIDKEQPAKMAAIEGEWTTEKPPAGFTVFAIPNQKEQRNYYSLTIPWALGLIATHSFETPILGVKDIIKINRQRIKNGMEAYGLLQKIHEGNRTPAILNAFQHYAPDLGFGLLLKKYTPTVTNATTAQISAAAKDTIPNVASIFWPFRIMIACGFFLLLLFIVAFILCARRTVWDKPWFLRIAFYSIPIPWLAIEMGWFLMEHGRQPWVVQNILPTFLGASSISVYNVVFSLTGFILFYTSLLVVELFLMFKYARLGPSSLHTGRYYFETRNTDTDDVPSIPQRGRE